MRTDRIYYFLFAVLVAVLASCSDDGLPSLKETYSKYDKNPFGTYIAFRQVNELFYRNDIKVKTTAADKSLGDFSDNGTLFISISKYFYLRGTELSSLLGYVKRGNNAFISAGFFDSSLIKELGTPGDKNGHLSFYPSLLGMKYTSVHLSAPYYKDTSSYSYYYNELNSSFTLREDNEDIRVLGRNANGDPDFIVVFYGKGRFYLHCEPRTLSNYFLLQDKNYRYLQYVFSFVPAAPGNIYWDDFYNKRDRYPAEDGSSDEDDNGKGFWRNFKILLKYPPMAWAFWLSLLLILVYMLFGGKRRQRIIKTIPQTENTSVAFTETVARLYLQKKDNRNIADKMITYLLEHIRNQYFINTNNLNEEFVSLLTRKTNVPAEQVHKLFNTISKVQRQYKVEDELLLSLNQQIENFYKHKQ